MMNIDYLDANGSMAGVLSNWTHVRIYDPCGIGMAQSCTIKFTRPQWMEIAHEVAMTDEHLGAA